VQKKYIDPETVENLQEQLVKLNRTTKVAKGGRNFSFSALMAVGNKDGIIGLGYAKAKEIPDAISKATDKAKKTLIKINLQNGTIPHDITEKYCSSVVWMKPASKGTGIIAGGTIRAVLELSGVHNILTKCFGSRNHINSSKAAMKCLTSLTSCREAARLREIDMESYFD